MPPLLALPTELKLEIISHLPHDPYPSLACLRRTHSSFLDLIPKAHICSKLSANELCGQLLKTELEYAYLLPPGHYPCYVCTRVLPLDAFPITPGRHCDCDDYEPYSRTRFCTDCSMLKKSRYRKPFIEYRRPFIQSLTWIAETLDDLPMPPLRPRLRSVTGIDWEYTESDLKVAWHMQKFVQQALDTYDEASWPHFLKWAGVFEILRSQW